jgi:ABC-2 type transport system ATP-binding protein
VSRAGTTVLVTTHYLDEAERCDRVAILHAGRLAALGTPGELKAAFEDRPILEIRSTSPVAVMTWLDAWPPVEKTSLFGTAVHAVLRGRDVAPAQVEAALKAAGLPPSSVVTVVPSLEDVFLDVVDRVESGSAA